MQVAVRIAAGLMVTFLSIGVQHAEAQQVSPLGKESPLAIYSLGLGAGALSRMNEDVAFGDEQLAKLSFIQSVYVSDFVDFFIDADWLPVTTGFGGLVGFEFMPSRAQFRPLLSVGLGAYHLDVDGPLERGFGATGMVAGGFALDLSEEVQVRIRVPFYITTNSVEDRLAGVDIGFLFSSPLRATRVQKL